MELPLPLPDDSQSYIASWIRWQSTVHQVSHEDIARALNDARIPAEGGEWTRDTIAQLFGRNIR